MGTRSKVAFISEDLPNELMDLRNKAHTFNFVISDIEKKEYLILNEDIELFWEDLVACIPPIGLHLLWEFPVFGHKGSLAQLASRLKSSISKEIEAQSEDFFMPDSKFHSVEVWSAAEDFREPYRRADSVYWTILFETLNTWQKTANINLVNIDWMINTQVVNIVMKWEGEFQTVESLEIEEVAHPLWVINFNKEQDSINLKLSNAVLLNAQLEAQRAGNILMVNVDNDRYLTIIIKVPRADIISASPPALPIPEKIIEQVVNYVLGELFSEYGKASERLEAALNKEINRLKPYMVNNIIDENLFNDLQNILHGLTSLREKYIKILQSWAEDSTSGENKEKITSSIKDRKLTSHESTQSEDSSKSTVARIMVIGSSLAGKTQFIQTISEIDVVTTELRPDKLDTTFGKTIGIDFGRVTISDVLKLYFGGTPGAWHFKVSLFEQSVLAKNLIGLVVMIHSFKPEYYILQETQHIIDILKDQSIPYVVAVNWLDDPDALDVDTLRTMLSVDEHIKMIPCDATDKESVKLVLLELLDLVPQTDITTRVVAKIESI